MFCDSYTTYFGESRCLGTKEVETCGCGSDTNKCTFYPEKRNPETLNTAEMWLKAQEDGKTYICNSVLYNKKTGFISATGRDPWPISVFDSIDTLMECQWSLYQQEIMTKFEAETKFGIRIVD